MQIKSIRWFAKVGGKACTNRKNVCNLNANVSISIENGIQIEMLGQLCTRTKILR